MGAIGRATGGEQKRRHYLTHATPFVVFTLDEQRYALRLSAVERIVRAVEVIPLPETPKIVIGMINVQGRVMPVVNIRSGFTYRNGK